MEWYKVELSAVQMANSATAKLQDEFDALWIALGHPKGFALFFLKTPSVPTTIYVSPMAAKMGAAIIKKYNGQPCAIPLASKTGFLLGHDEDKNLLPNN